MKHDIRILKENFQTALKKLNENATTPKEEEKIVKAKQNGDKSYTVEYSDGTTKTIAVSNDAWDKINDMYGKLTEANGFKSGKEFINIKLQKYPKAIAKVNQLINMIGESNFTMEMANWIFDFFNNASYESPMNEAKSNPEVDKLLKVMDSKKAGPEYKKALMDLIAMAEKKSGTTVNTKKEALLALDYIEPTIREDKEINGIPGTVTIGGGKSGILIPTNQGDYIYYVTDDEYNAFINAGGNTQKLMATIFLKSGKAKPYKPKYNPMASLGGGKGYHIDEDKLIEDHTDIKKIIKQIAYLYNDAKKLGHSKASIDNMYQQSNAEAKTQSGDDKNEEAEGFNGEYDDEAGMAHTNLHTIARAAEGLLNTIGDHENLPEWVQEKIAKVEGMIVTAWDYLQSQEEQGIDPEINEMYESMNQLVEDVALKNLVSVDTVWESFEALDDQILYETAAWSRKEGKNKTGGLNAKGVASYRRENPGSKLQTAVTTKPSKLKPGSKAAKRRKSFCARMSGVKGPAKKPNGEPTRKTLALRKWNC